MTVFDPKCAPRRHEVEASTCRWHGGTLDGYGQCPTVGVLNDVSEERTRQFRRYGTNDDLKDGTGPETRWLGPYTGVSASMIEADLRAEYEDFEGETGTVTWLHLVREEIAEAFCEDDPSRLRDELIQVAALAVSWVEKIDARRA